MHRRPWLLGLPLLLLLGGCNSLFFYPTRKIHVQPEKLGIRYTDYRIPLSNGEKIHGRVFHRTVDTAQQGLFILFHGNAQNLTAHFLQFAWVLPRGYDLFVFDFPGYGLSEGRPTRKGSIESGAAALDFVSSHLLPAPGGRLVVVGESLGGAIMLRTMADWKDKDKVTLVVAECTFPSYQGAARSALSKSWLTWSLQPLAYALVTEAGSPKDHIRRISPTPLLAATCLEDDVVDPKFTRAIYRLADNPKWLWEIPDCGHIAVFKPRQRRERLLALVDSLAASRERRNED